jgi:hypothetical protein
MVEVEVQMYYDEYERDYGDGFYPVFSYSKRMKSISILFEYDNEKQVWVQKTEEMIKGLDESCGDDLLELLNKKGGVKGVGIYSYCCISKFGILLIRNRNISRFYKRPMISGASSSGFSIISPLNK